MSLSNYVHFSKTGSRKVTRSFVFSLETFFVILVLLLISTDGAKREAFQQGARILFVHIPKCGGEAVKDKLKDLQHFTFWQHRSFNWDEYLLKEEKQSETIPKNLILEHHTTSRPISQISKDIIKLQKLWAERGIAHFEFVIIREPSQLQASLYSYCSKKLVNKHKLFLPKLWYNIVQCTVPNFLYTYIKSGKWGCRKLTQELRSSYDYDAECNIVETSEWLTNLRIYDLGELDVLRRDINIALKGLARLRFFQKKNQARIPQESFYSRFPYAKLSSTNCGFSKSTMKRLKFEMRRNSTADLHSTTVESMKESHILCDVQLYKYLLKMRSNDVITGRFKSV